MKIFKRVSAVLLCAVMLIGILPMGVFAESVINHDDYADSVGVSDETVMGRLLNNTIQTSSADNSGFSISYIEVKGKTATVDISNDKACKVVVAIYDPDTDKMLASGMTDIDENAGTAQVSINITTMPKYYIVRAFALDSNMSALCAKYESRHYTKEFEDFYDLTPDDFSDKNVVLMQDDTVGYEEKELDFGVLSDDVSVGTTSSSMEITYDNNTKSYIFTNATNEVKNLKSGDKYFYQFGENNTEFIVIKVVSVSVSGNTVTVKEDENVGLADIFDHIKIDTYGDYETAEISDVGEGITVVGESISTQSFDYDDNTSKDVSVAINVHDPKAYGTITGSIKVSLSVNAKCYYDAVFLGKDYYEVKIETTTAITGSVSITGKVDFANIADWKFFDESLYVGVFDLEVTIKPEFSISVTASFSLTYSKTVTVTSDSNNKFNKSEKEKKKLDGDISGSVTITLGLNVTIKFALYLPPHGKDLAKKSKIGFLKDAYSEVVSLSVTLAGGLKASGKTNNIEPTHPCSLCISGSISLYGKLSGNLKICIVPYILDWTFPVTIASYEKPIWDFYFSTSATPHFAVGECGTVSCPNKYIEVQVKVTDSVGRNIKDAVVSAPNCICDANGDGQYNETEINTDVNGLATIYLKKGNHTVSATYKGETKSRGVEVLNVSKTIIISFASTNPDNPDQPGTGSSDGTGSNDGIESSTIIRFGSYPQSDVTASMGSILNSKASGWKSYNYYSGSGSYSDGQMTAKSYMQYCDVTYNGNKYRGVTFGTYRPYYTGNESTTSTDYTYQDDNGYTYGNIYWFQYEPLRWRILDASTGLVMCETIIDSQPYSNYIKYNSDDGEYYNDKGTYSSDWKTSSLKSWLNEDFLSTAFTLSQQNKIISQSHSNKGYYTLIGTTGYERYDSDDTSEKIYLLSYDEASNSNYFNSSTARMAQGSDYAKCQGLYVYNGNSYWRLRSPGYDSGHSCRVYGDGDVSNIYGTYSTYIGVRPALKLNLSSLSTQSDIGTQAVVGTGVFKYSCSACEAGGEYILLNVTGYGNSFTLTSSNLEYIDQVTADASGKVSGKFMPRKNVSGSTTILIGKFGTGISAKKLTVTEETTGSPDPEVIPDINIKNYKSSLSVDYKAKLIFHSDIEAPKGYKIVWSNGDEGSTCTIEQAVEGEYKIKADLVKTSDNKVVKSTKVETVKVNTGFFAKIIAFFRNLFKSLPVYEDNNKK